MGDLSVYPTTWLDSSWLLLLLGAPVLLFLGFYVAKILYRDREFAEPTDVVVMPHDMTWLNYTHNARVITEISRAVVQVRLMPPIAYEQIAHLLQTQEAHRVAADIGDFHVYREQELRKYLDTAYQVKQQQQAAATDPRA